MGPCSLYGWHIPRDDFTDPQMTFSHIHPNRMARYLTARQGIIDELKREP
jgi:hypothetical protein